MYLLQFFVSLASLFVQLVGVLLDLPVIGTMIVRLTNLVLHMKVIRDVYLTL